MEQPAVVYGNYLSTATAAATDSAAGTDPAHVLTGIEDTYWTPGAAAGDKALTFDLGEIRTVDRLCLLGEPLDGVQVDLHASTDNFAFSDVEILAGQTLSAAVNAASLYFLPVSYRYWRLTFKDGFIPSPFRLAHVLLAAETVLPFFELDFDPDAFEVESEPLLSQEGMYLGTNVERALGTFSLAWGQVTETEYVDLQSWARACVGRAAFFLLPDRSAAETRFGWVKGKFSAPRRNGLRAVSAMTFTTRSA